MLSLREAQERLLALATPTSLQSYPIASAAGHFTARTIHAVRSQPEFDLSAMDGWAVRASDLPGPFRITGESAAGVPHDGAVGPGEAVRISTGAIVPDGADAVVIQEDCEKAGQELRLTGDAPSPPGRHIRKAGFDFRAGDALIEAGVRLTPARIALGIAAGHSEIACHAPPRVSIVDTGTELRAIGDDLSPGQIPASNGAMIAAMLNEIPVVSRNFGPIQDDRAALRASFDKASDADVVIITGGASVGDHDLVVPVLEEMGAQLAFWRVAIKPGKPILVATRGSTIFLGLPGNPVSAFVTAHLFALPLIRALSGSSAPFPRYERLPAAQAIAATGKRAEFVRATVDEQGVRPLAVQDSSALRALAMAEVLIVRPAHAAEVETGQACEILRIA